ncbi:hypothetical protein Acr_00g0077400 [Actinidia rufa]|uniref:Protein kinase domain-containing protein n=1 Tax=Actinidia rufa TaxID=165716 RepID=A0A7J0DT93_9ERIC|nr:hypothetical protein Acr_00g0077400 [Actinidia rufa]
MSSLKRSVHRITIIIIVIVGVVALAAISIACFICCGRWTRKTQLEKSSSELMYKKEFNNTHKQQYYKKGEHGKLYFVRNGRERFELHDLLKASAEVMGSGSLGSSYKATLLDGGTTMVVKRREEKLLISDFVDNGSLASHLHGKRSRRLDWPARLKIIKGVARGLAYLYKELPSLTLPHGHLKSSNVLLDDTFEPLLQDYALVSLINKGHAQQFMVAYKSPEFSQHDFVTKKTDVWSLGILILEMLTGKFPTNYLKQGKSGNADLAAWVNSVLREEWTDEVFDIDMKGMENGEGEMLKLLKIGMCCCEWNVERRWDLREAIEKIEELKERDSDEENSSSGIEGDVYSSRGMTEDAFSFSVNG